MRKLSSTTGPISYGETSWDCRDITETTSGKIIVKELIAKANSVPLSRVLRYYKILCNELHNNATCPFKTHKGGLERTGSFYFYPETNSFYCFGCKIGGKSKHAVELVSAIEGITSHAAAKKIISLFNSDIGSCIDYDDNFNVSEQLEIMMDFSNIVREFRNLYLDPSSQEFIEKRCEVYDMLNLKHDMNIETLQYVIDQLKEQIKIYVSSLENKILT